MRLDSLAVAAPPLYAFKEVFASGHVALKPGNILAILSLFFRTLMIGVSVKQVGLLMRADNHGEGGLMALLALAAAYGISVSLVMVITTVLTFFVIRYGWNYPLPACIAATGAAE